MSDPCDVLRRQASFLDREVFDAQRQLEDFVGSTKIGPETRGKQAYEQELADLQARVNDAQTLALAAHKELHDCEYPQPATRSQAAQSNERNISRSQVSALPAGFTVLFGGGDAGGFQVTSTGEVIPIDPYPGTMTQLKKASELLETLASLKQQTAHLSNEQFQQHLREVTRLATESLAESLKPLFASQHVEN